MNKRRRRIGKARRAKARLIHEMRVWSKCGYERLPKGGRLARPAARLAADFDVIFQRGFAQIQAIFEPMVRWARGERPATPTGSEGST